MRRQDAGPKRNNRRSFLKGSLAVAGVSALGSPNLFAQSTRRLTNGDAAILKFLAAAELIETDLWQQYAELGGVTTGDQNAYQMALQQLDPDGSQYITSNTLDELSHATFLNAYLVMRDQEPVNLDQFRTLPSSQATGAASMGRLTNLTQLSVDTSWYTRYRSTTNPDFGATFVQAIPALAKGPFSAIPKTNADFGPAGHVQALANTAAFHFASIEQGGSSLYSTLAQLVSDPEVLRIVISIGGDEVAHFLEWVDFAGNAVQPPVAPVTDPNNGLVFPNFDATPNPLLQTNLIFPVPCEFINASLPHCAVIRPTAQGQIDAVGAATALTASGLFIGQPQSFIQLLLEMAIAADSAVRGR
jgi:Ferritin-like domain/TAT (twin-arginine translocation) pathway signal sequence